MLSFIALFMNFFLPLDRLFNSIILLSGVFILILKKKIKFEKVEICFLIIVSLLASLLILYSNVNRPDAGLYHLPYVSILNENKIIIGLSNLHFRFGHVSIIQYLSAINNNFILGENGIVIPLASIVSAFFVFFFNNVFEIFRKKEIDTTKIFSLFIIVFISYKINRYSSFGNDAVGHLTLLYLISYFLQNKKPDLKYLILISVFAFLNKTTMVISFLIPLFVFIKTFKLSHFKLLVSFPSTLLALWIIKNLLISGCVLYPLKETCILKFQWTDIVEAKNENMSAEAWAKSWPDRQDKNVSMENFNKNFNWFNSWRLKHGVYLMKIFIPYIILVFFFMSFLAIHNEKNKLYKIEKNISFYLSIIICLIGSFLFFTKFPLFRYGYSYILGLIILFPLIFLNKISVNRIQSLAKFVFFVCVFVVCTKQILRYVENYNSDYTWPRIYSFQDNKKIKSDKIILSNLFSVYKAQNLCMYSKAPCTNYNLKDNIIVLKKKNYIFINLKNN